MKTSTQQVVFVDNNKVLTDSLTVAETFGKRHDRVLQDVREMDCSDEFRDHHFVESTYSTKQKKQMPRYLISEQGFSFLAMGYTGKDAARFKEMYINEFTRMRDELSKALVKAPANPIELVLYQADMFKAIASAMVDNQAKMEALEGKMELVESTAASKEEVNDLRRGLVDIDAPLRTDLHALVSEYATLTGKPYRDTWHYLYDNLNSRNKCNIQRRAENRTKKSGKEVKKLDIIEEMRLLPDAIRFMKAVNENLKLLAKTVQPQIQGSIEPF